MKTTKSARSAQTSAAELADVLRLTLGDDRSVELSIGDCSVSIPDTLANALLELLEDVSEGRDVTPAPAGLPLGTDVASDLLGVSRQWLTILLDRGEIPSTRVGSKRRVRLGDVLAYRRTDDSRRRKGLTWEFLDDE